jgi:transcriptional regulator with XRE-family HTH domain
VNVLKPHLQTTLRTLLEAGASQREIERVTGIDRKTIRSYQRKFAASNPRMDVLPRSAGRSMPSAPSPSATTR